MIETSEIDKFKQKVLDRYFKPRFVQPLIEKGLKRVRDRADVDTCKKIIALLRGKVSSEPVLFESTVFSLDVLLPEFSKHCPTN